MTHPGDAPATLTIDFDALRAVDIRVGTIVSVEPFPEARKPAPKRAIGLGPVIGTKRSGAQITGRSRSEDLAGRQVAAVVNVPSRRIVSFLSEVRTLGFGDEAGAVVLFRPDRAVPNGSRLF